MLLCNYLPLKVTDYIFRVGPIAPLSSSLKQHSPGCLIHYIHYRISQRLTTYLFWHGPSLAPRPLLRYLQVSGQEEKKNKNTQAHKTHYVLPHLISSRSLYTAWRYLQGSSAVGAHLLFLNLRFRHFFTPKGHVTRRLALLRLWEFCLSVKVKNCRKYFH